MNRSNITAWAFALAVATAAAFHSDGARAAGKPEGCLGGILSTDAVGDFVLTKPCTVNAGAYKLGRVWILAGGTLTFTDANIDFWASSILIEKDGALVAGSPNVPIGNNGTLTIHLYGADQTGTDPAKQGIGIPCASDAVNQCGVPNEIWSSNVVTVDGNTRPKPPAQARKVSELSPAVAAQYPGVKDDYFYAYNPLTFDEGKSATNPVGYFGYKVLGVSYGGTLQLFGKKGATLIGTTTECGPMTSPGNTSWVRLDANAPVGASVLTVDRQLDLKAGDKLVVTTTDYMPGHSEEVAVLSDVKCGTEIKIDPPMKYAHNGTRFGLTGVPEDVGLDPTLRANGAETRAAVGMLTRSIRIVSAGDLIDQDFPVESSGYYFGGHLVVRQGFKQVQIQGVEFAQMGQGGRIGHYPVHFHHARLANPDTFVRDSSINESMTRWIVLHATSNVTLERNVGWKSIGHGFYLEDGTETNNALIANLGVFARAAVKNVQNPRFVPGILAAPNLHTSTGEAVPYRSDYDHPTVFWIMNAYNDFRDNVAAGAGTCGVCYWLLPGAISTMSRDQRWASYASIQNGTDRAGMAPLKSFAGNACVAAMTAFQTITATESCQGIGPGDAPEPHPLNLPPILNPLPPITVAPDNSTPEVVKAVADAVANYYPTLGDGGHFPTQCTADDCSVNPVRCSAGNLVDCMVTTLDRFTTSFNWAAFNFAAIWLRPQWYLVTDSVITDSQQAGLTMVTGGGYSESDVIPGHWALVRKSVFIGNTQDESFNPYTSNGGPFNPKTIRCAMDANFNRPGSFCLSVDEGVSHQVSNFGMYQRLFSVYDGPAFQDSNAYLNITKRMIDDCKPFVDLPNKTGRCDPVLNPNQPRQSAWIAGYVNGLPMGADDKGPFCYMPNAAIGWKQPNGFFYPPAFHSLNIFFDNVDIRHFVISPLFVEGTLTTNIDKVSKAYCNWNGQLFTGFAGNDRQTVLNDDDGTLTGYAKTTVINLDEFFAAPVDALQCRSDKSSRTSPYEYVSTVVYPACVLNGTCALPPVKKPDGTVDPNWNSGSWNRACTNENCYGVPLWRQDAMPLADEGAAKSIRMMGQETSQRSSLTVNNGTYYIDTTVSEATQLACGSTDTGNPCVVNVFKENESYYLFLIFAKESTAQTYRFYVGDPNTTTFDPASIRMVQAQIGLNPIKYDDLGTLPAGRARWLGNDKASSKGVVEVDLKLSDLPGVADKFKMGKENKCGPATYCKWYAADAQGKPLEQPMCADKNNIQDDSACKWAVADQDCPAGGCYGIRFTLPQGFATLVSGAPNPRPPSACVPATDKDGKPTPFNVQFDEVPEIGVCPQPADLKPRDFCA